MGKLILVAGNLGAGKTTLTKLICERNSFVPYWESPEVRPFQFEFAKDLKRWALTNQIDFFLFRTMQELAIRQSKDIGVQDGGLDQDFHVFTRHFRNQGYLSQEEFDICRNFYILVRKFLPPPDLIIRIKVSIPTLLERRFKRGRVTDDQLVAVEQLLDLEILMDEWIKQEKSSLVITFSFETHTLSSNSLEHEKLIFQIKESLNIQ